MRALRRGFPPAEAWSVETMLVGASTSWLVIFGVTVISWEPLQNGPLDEAASRSGRGRPAHGSPGRLRPALRDRPALDPRTRSRSDGLAAVLAPRGLGQLHGLWPGRHHRPAAPAPRQAARRR